MAHTTLSRMGQDCARIFPVSLRAPLLLHFALAIVGVYAAAFRWFCFSRPRCCVSLCGSIVGCSRRCRGMFCGQGRYMIRVVTLSCAESMPACPPSDI